MRKTKLILIFFAFIFTQKLHAQISELRTFNLSIGADLNIAERLLRQTHQRGFGGTAKVEYVFAKHTSTTASVGYASFFESKLVNVPVQKLSGIPLKAGLRYYLGNFYAASEAGVVIKTGYLTGNAFVYSFAVGDEIVTSKRNQNSLDISLRHEGWVGNQQYNFIGIRLAYEFRLK